MQLKGSQTVRNLTELVLLEIHSSKFNASRTPYLPLDLQRWWPRSGSAATRNIGHGRPRLPSARSMSVIFPNDPYMYCENYWRFIHRNLTRLERRIYHLICSAGGLVPASAYYIGHGRPRLPSARSMSVIFPNDPYMYCEIGRSSLLSVRPWPIFRVAADWPGGMSGGPVFNEAGHVVGIVSADAY
jgi:hypothetical protein